MVIAWPDRLHVMEPAPLITVAERLERKGGRELVARCPSQKDAQETADWLVDRSSRLAPGLPVTASVDAGGGQFLLRTRRIATPLGCEARGCDDGPAVG